MESDSWWPCFWLPMYIVHIHVHTYVIVHVHKMYVYIIAYSRVFLRGVYFVNFEIAAIHGIIRKPHPST